MVCSLRDAELTYGNFHGFLDFDWLSSYVSIVDTCTIDSKSTIDSKFDTLGPWTFYTNESMQFVLIYLWLLHVFLFRKS